MIRWRYMVALLIGIATAMAALAHRLIPDGLDGAALALLMGDTAKYGAGYNDRAFRAVRVGMGEHEVQALLGEPLKRVNIDELDPEGSVVWVYSLSPTKGNYRVRSILFGRDRRVLEKNAGYWID